jgi:hypothetical protein
MNELKELEDFRAAVVPPGAAVLARARAQMLATGPPSGPRHRAGLSRRAWRLAGIGVVAAGTAVALTVALITPSAPSSSSPRGGVALDAKIVLERAATAYLKLPTPRGDQYLYSVVRIVGTGPAIRQRSWISADGSRPSVSGVFPCRQVPASTRISAKLRKYYDSCLSSVVATPGPRAETTYSGMRSLPTGPAALLAYLARHNACPGFTQADGEWGQVSGIFDFSPVVPPALGAALLRAAAQIPGVRVLPRVSFAGGSYVGVVRTLPPGQTSQWHRIALIFDPHTYRLVGTLELWSLHPITHATGLGSGLLLVSRVLVQASVVNSAPVIPSGLGLAKPIPGPPLSCDAD